MRLLPVLRFGSLLCLALLAAPGLAEHAGMDVIRAAGVAGPGNLPLGWSTFLGISDNDSGHVLTVDGQGNVYVTGKTFSTDFHATPGAAQPRYGGPALDFLAGGDAYVTSYDARGRLRWSTYLGGKGDDIGEAIPVDGHGNVYVTGWTNSTNFPVTPGAAQPRFGGGDYDAFVASYTTDGKLRWSTYLGGGDTDDGSGIAVDGLGDVSVAGYTRSTNLPHAAGVAEPFYGSGFLVLLDQRGQLHRAAYLINMTPTAIAADRQGNLYLTGGTGSGFSATTGAAQPQHSNDFVAKLDPGWLTRWATYLGGSGDDDSLGIAVDGQGNVYVTGKTQSTDFHVTPGVAQPHFGGAGVDFGGDAFVAAYTGDGRLRWSTYLGGKGDDMGKGIAVDGQGDVYIIGETGSTIFPDTTPVPSDAGDISTTEAFVASYNSSGQLCWATRLGGSLGGSTGVAIDVGGQGDVYLTGATLSQGFPITPGAAQTIQADTDAGEYSFGDAFLIRMIIPATHPDALDPVAPPPSVVPHSRYFPQTHHTLSGDALAFWDKLGSVSTLGLPLSEPFTLAGERIQVTERAVLILDSSAVQLLPLGRLLSAARAFAPVPAGSATGGELYFPSTGHTLAGPFLAYWQAHQGSTLLGAPIAQPDREGLGDGTGDAYLVQWFANGRLEFHPEIADPRYQVEQGRVGYEYLHRLGLL